MVIDLLGVSELTDKEGASGLIWLEMGVSYSESTESTSQPITKYTSLWPLHMPSTMFQF